MRREHSPANSINLSVCRFAVVAVGQRGGAGTLDSNFLKSHNRNLYLTKEMKYARAASGQCGID